jgi:NADH-quinone oxidoreductase subunit L
MFIALGMRAADAAFLHLITHAFFKACLFLSAGSIIHALHHSEKQSHEHFDAQDIRNMGGARTQMPVTFIAFVVSAASLTGIPFTSGFLSKEFILTALSNQNHPFAQVMYITTLILSFITALYTIRLVWFVFFLKNHDGSHTVSESPIIMRIPIVILASLSLWFIVSPDPFDFSGWIVDTNAHDGSVLMTSLLIIATGIIAGYGIFRKNIQANSRLLENAFYLDSFSQRSIQKSARTFTALSAFGDRQIDKVLHLTAFAHVTLSHVIAWVDKYIVDGLVLMFAGIIRSTGNILRNFTAGKIQHYIFWSLFAIIIFIIWSIN